MIITDDIFIKQFCEIFPNLDIEIVITIPEIPAVII